MELLHRPNNGGTEAPPQIQHAAHLQWQSKRRGRTSHLGGTMMEGRGGPLIIEDEDKRRNTPTGSRSKNGLLHIPALQSKPGAGKRIERT
ncbi:hypothetical protein Z043_110170 [Scleropages formosus]|uniref:Uncharacterized protein n=1 Tax=Scleropages formosus TaxID=113540 RepID=A0A0P7V7T3_SCLFO|nr:hypothetical protein Z043_110170 [Scleropages formosus]